MALAIKHAIVEHGPTALILLDEIETTINISRKGAKSLRKKKNIYIIKIWFKIIEL